MPKEITHWLVALDTVNGLPKNSFLFNAIKSNINIYQCAATLPDTPYYCLGSRCQPLKKAANHLHCQLQNSFAPLLTLLKTQNNIPLAAEISFISGLISHIITDGVFHPLIFFLSGNDTEKGNKEATSRHRHLETLLDQFYMQNLEPTGEKLLSSYFENLEISRKDFLTLAKTYLGIADKYSDSIQKAISNHCLCQKMFFNPKAAMLVKLFNYLFRGHLKDIAALFYEDKPERNPFNDNFIGYQHPVTGKTHYTNSLELKQKAIDAALEVFILFADTTNGDEFYQILKSIPGPNMTTGLTKSTSTEMQYFKIK